MKIHPTIFLVSLVRAVQGACNVDEHHPLNGGYFVEGINGFVKNETTGSVLNDPNSDETGHNPWTNSTWAVGIDYPDGSVEICTGRFCSEKCKTEGCAKVIEGTTCSHIRFCYEETSGSDLWKLPDEVALANCDFTNAEQVCSESAGSDTDCCNYIVEEDHNLEIYFFASKNGCEEGQRVAMKIGDYDDVGNACYGMGLTSSRINKCTCTAASTLSEPCHSEFRQGCLKNSPDLSGGDECCGTENCVGNHQNINHPTGEKMEQERVALCRDNIPGNCQTGSESDCCTKSCSECGIALNPFAKWAQCSEGSATAGTGNCGRLSAYSSDPFVCDFTSCESNHKWHHTTDAFKDWVTTVDPTGSVPSSSEAKTVFGGIASYLSLVLFFRHVM